MGRRKKDTWDIGQVDSLRQAMFDQAREEFGAGAVYTGTEAEQRIVGLPIPALCLRYLFRRLIKILRLYQTEKRLLYLELC